MKTRRVHATPLASLLPLLLVMLVACNATSGTPLEEDVTKLSVEQRAAYAIGVNLARQLSTDGLDIDLDYLSRGFKDAEADGELLLDDAGLDSAIKELQEKANELRQVKVEAEAEENSAAGRAFLEENRSKEGVKESESGLQYMVMTEGEGPKPTLTDRVKVHYTGSTLDGTVFDSSVERGTPATFGVNQVIPGFTEALMMMSPGAKYKVWIPDTLGYGLNVRPGAQFGPNELLVFDMELISIEK